jgi:hypothetical protein
MDLRMNINIMEEYSAMNKYFFFTITVLGWGKVPVTNGGPDA